MITIPNVFIEMNVINNNNNTIMGSLPGLTLTLGLFFSPWL